MVDSVLIESVIEDKATEAATGHQVLSFDRRRAGRIEVAPVLVPLLRDPGSAVSPALGVAAQAETPYRDFLDNDPFTDPMAPARGIVLGLTISMLFWGAVGYAIFR